MQLREQTIRGVRATLLGTVSGALLQTVILVVLARLLTPLDYGAYAAANILMLPLQALVLSTTERAIVIQGELSEDSLSSVQGIMFWLMVGVAVVIGASGLVAAERFHNLIGATFAAYAPILPISALTMTARAHLRRRMAFGKMVVVDLIAQTVGVGGVTISFALMGFGPFSLVLGAIAVMLIQALGYRWGAIAAVRIRTNFAEARPTLRTAYLVGKISFLEVIQGQIPSVFIGAILGATQLGFFSRAYSLVQMPIELLTTSISRVLYSSFASVREEKEKFVRALYHLVECATVVIFPIAIGMAVAAPQLVGVILGSRWQATEPLIVWITLASALTMTGTLFANVIEAALHLNAKFYGLLISLCAGIVLFALLTRHGLIDACIALAGAWLLYFLGQVCLAKVLLHLSTFRLFASMTPGLVGGVVVGLYIFAVQTVLHTLSPVMMLIIEIAGCGVLLVGVVGVLFPRLFRELLNYAGLGRFVSV